MRTVITLGRRAVRFELGLYRSLFRWVTSRPAVPANAAAFSYAGVVTALMWVFVAVSAIELVVLHLLLPWETVRLVADILGVWGLLWMLGLLASFRVYPHVVGEACLRVRHGFSTDLAVPWDAVATIGVRERGREKSRAIQFDRHEDGTVMNVVIAGRTNVDVKLHRPVVVGEESVTEIRLFADDASELVARTRERFRSGARD